MRDFSQLLDALVYTRSRNAKLKLIGDYLKRTPDPDRGYALAALTGELNLPAVKPAAIRAIAEERVDPVLLYMSRDYVGDMAETVSLLWPGAGRSSRPISTTARCGSSNVVERLASLGRAEAPGALAAMLDHLDASGRFALLKLATGALRIGISARLAKVALAEAFGLDVDAVEEVWHGIGPPYPPIFDWAEGRGAQPTAEDVPGLPPVHARPSARGGAGVARRLCSPSGNGTGSASSSSMPAARPGSTAAPATTSPAASPTSPRRSPAEGVLDGELLVKGAFQGGAGAGGAASFNALQQRLGRKNVSAKMLGDYPAFVRLYDILFDGAGGSARRCR